ncbi:uncharacterized protein PFL1_01188 [Pseudozyma flocculosa PF-1]|nr:uncharacterized protein PFL1_01188 [Pseudozyma flocculosa PF-1]EPQ30999.1 hypothetical protein PFL1_01188 [Pseudozyma flocculosa PF-1]
MSAHRDLLTAIAEKERRCFELREELRLEELELKRLQESWQSTVHRELAYSSAASSTTSPTAHRRSMSSSTFSERSLRSSHTRGESNDSIPQAAAEAWNSISSKLPGSFKNGLTNLFEQMAVNPSERREVEGPQPPPEVPQKGDRDRDGLAPPSSMKSAGNHLTIGTGRSLSVLEEEMSDNGSATPAALSPRSPLAPIRHLADGSTAPAAAAAAAAAADADRHRRESRGSSAHGTPPQAHRGFGGELIDEAGPPTPPKTDPGSSNTPSRSSLWQSKRSSVLGSLSNLQKQVFQSPSSPSSPKLGNGERRSSRSSRSSSDANGTQSPTAPSSSGWGLGGTWAKKLKEARENASDMLREAERKLGNAMTIDELLGLPPSSSGSSIGSSDRERSTLDQISSSTSLSSLGGGGGGGSGGGGGGSNREREADSANLLWRKMNASDMQRHDERMSTSSRPEDSPWFAAAGGHARRRSLQRNSASYTSSPHLSPSIDPRRLSIASTQSASSANSGSGERRRSVSPNSPRAFADGAASPPALGVMGSGILGLISQAWSPEARAQDGIQDGTGAAESGEAAGYLNVGLGADQRRRRTSGNTLSPHSAAAERRTSMLSEIGDRMGNNDAKAASPSLSGGGQAWEWGSDGWGEAISPNRHTPSPRLDPGPDGGGGGGGGGGGIRLSLIDVDDERKHLPPSSASAPGEGEREGEATTNLFPPLTPTLTSSSPPAESQSATPRQDTRQNWI